MNHTKKLAVFLALALAVGLAAPAMAAVTNDTSGTDATTTTSDLTAGQTVTDLDNSTKNKTVEVNTTNASSASDLTAYFTVNDSDSTTSADEQKVVATFEGDSEWYATDSAAGHYAFNFSHAEAFETLPRTINENVTVDLYIVVNESETSEESLTLTFYAENGDDWAVIDVDNSSEDGDDADAAVFEKGYLFTKDVAEIEEDVSVNGSTTDVRYVFSDSDVQSAASDAVDRDDDLSAEGVVWAMPLSVEDTPHLTYYKEADGDADEEDTYGVYKPSSNTYEVMTGEDYEDKNSLDMTVTANDKLGFWRTLRAFGTSEAIDQIGV